MKRRRKIYESDDLKRENIVGEEEKQNQQEAMENCEEPKRKVKRSKRVREQVKDEDDENATPSATPTGDNGTEPAEELVPMGMEQEEPEDENNPAVEYILQALKDREEKLKQQNDQQFAAQRQIYDQDFNDFMKDIESYIASNKK
jgi:uncharacterized protein with von Willebrand factor type A (vWA) domain